MRREIKINSFTNGLITSLEARSLPRGAASYNKNWLSKGDKIEIRRGMTLIGAEQTGNGRVSGIGVGFNGNNTPLLIYTHGRKIKFYDRATELFTEISTDLLPVGADGEDTAITSYASLAGYQMWLSSPNSGLYKIMSANPESCIDNYLEAKNYKGLIAIKQSRMTLWGRIKDKTAPYKSYIDEQNFVTVDNEVLGSGDGVVKTFIGTLAFKAGNPINTAFAVVVTDGVETFTDGYDGILTGNLGGSGTINYSTGAISVTFNTAPVLASNNVIVDYQHENSTDGGIADFTNSDPDRLAGEGVSFRQDDNASPLQAILQIEDQEFCFHQKNTWKLTLTIDDTNAENIIYSERAGIPNWRAADADGVGIYYIDVSDNTDPKFMLLSYSAQNAKIEPHVISNNLDLSEYEFDRSVVKVHGDLVLFECRSKNSSYNDTTFVYNKVFNIFDKLDYIFSCLAEYEGTLVAGDDISNNVYEIFSGYDDDDSIIDADWITEEDRLDTEELKKTKQLIIKGEIQLAQTIEVSASLDGGDFVKIGDIIGSGDYVDQGINVSVGASKMGHSTIGGGSATEVIAHPYTRRFKLSLDKFYEVRLRFRTTGLGYCSITSYAHRDIRLKGHKIPTKYRSDDNK